MAKCFWFHQGKCALDSYPEDLVFEILASNPEARESILTCTVCGTINPDYIAFAEDDRTILQDAIEFNQEVTAIVRQYNDRTEIAQLRSAPITPVVQREPPSVEPEPEPFAPEDVLDFYFEAGDINISDGSPIGQWVDRNGQVTLEQTTPARQPIYRTSVGGHPGVEFNRFDSLFFEAADGEAASAIFEDGAAWSFFIIYRNAATTNTFFSRPWGAGTIQTQTRFTCYIHPSGSNGDRQLQMIDDSGTDNAAVAWDLGNIGNGFDILTFGGYGDVINQWTNGVQYLVDSPIAVGGPATYDLFSVGCLRRGTSVTNPYDGDMHAIGFKIGVLTATERAQLEEYANTTFGFGFSL